MPGRGLEYVMSRRLRGIYEVLAIVNTFISAGLNIYIFVTIVIPHQR